MGRGKLLRTKVRAEKALVKARLQAAKEWESHKSNAQYSIKKILAKAAEKLTVDDLLTIATGAWSAYAFNDPTAFLWGAIGYKLATTSGGSPPVCQIAGLAVLSGLGLASGGAEMLASFIKDVGEDVTKFVAAPISTPDTDLWFEETQGKVPFHLWKRAKMEEKKPTGSVG